VAVPGAWQPAVGPKAPLQRYALIRTSHRIDQGSLGDVVAATTCANPAQRVKPARIVTGMRGVRHRTRVISQGEGVSQAACECGWRSEPYGVDKESGTMDALQRAREAADLHEWEASLGEL
jgi:glucose-6-phosphate dehydrogenase assembly protein OpcA